MENIKINVNIDKQLEPDMANVTVSDAIAKAIYRAEELEYTIQDAVNHVDDYISENEFVLTDEEWEQVDYNYLAEKFLDNHDCNIADNDQWEYIVENHIKKILHI